MTEFQLSEEDWADWIAVLHNKNMTYEVIKQECNTSLIELNKIRAAIRQDSKSLVPKYYQLHSACQLLLKALELAVNTTRDTPNISTETPDYWLEKAANETN